MSFLLVITVGMAVVPHAGRQDPATPAEAVKAFYAGYAAKSFSGLPHEAELAAVSPRMSAGLLKLLRAAAIIQARCIKAHPDDKGPWVEGDMFTSNFEGFTTFEPDSVQVTGLKAVVLVRFSYTESGKTFKWGDRAVVVKEAGRWVLDDVRYRPAKGFTSGFGSSLRRSLASDGKC